MKSLIQVFVLSLFFSSAQATLIEANYAFDGTEFTLENGQDVFNMNYQEGDTLRLTISASGEGSYWDFSGHSTRSFDGFDLAFSESNYRGIDGMYRFYFEDSLLNESYFYTTLDDNRGGPYSLSVRNIDFVDKFSIDYRLLDSSATSNQLAPIDAISANWSIWNTFGGFNNRVSFINGQSVSVSEPPTLAILCAIFLLASRAVNINTNRRN